MCNLIDKQLWISVQLSATTVTFILQISVMVDGQMLMYVTSNYCIPILVVFRTANNIVYVSKYLHYLNYLMCYVCYQSLIKVSVFSSHVCMCIQLWMDRGWEL
jgi:hypothetical protein